MARQLRTIRITDRLGTDYTDLFADVDFGVNVNADVDYGATATAIDTTVVSSPHSPLANPDGPLGALIVRWIQARVESPSDRFAWQYVDATDTHTIAFVDGKDLRFANIFGRVDRGRRVYDLREIALELELLVDVLPTREQP